MFSIFLYGQLHFSPLVLGVVLATGNLGIGGAFFAQRLAAAGFGSAAQMRLLLTVCGPIFEELLGG
jgi:hypothetical protein